MPVEVPLQGNERKDKWSAITILACCVLHNIGIDVGDPSPIEVLGDDEDDMDQSLNGDVSPITSDVRDKIIVLNKTDTFPSIGQIKANLGKLTNCR